MHSLRIPLVLIISGVALLLVCVPLLDGYEPKAGLLGNIQEMTLPITRDKMEPDFREVASFESGGTIMNLPSGTEVRFSASTPEEDMLAALNAFPGFKSDKGLPGFMRFEGWKVAQHGLRIPFKYITFLGLLVAFAGSILLIWGTTKTKQETKAV